MALIRANAVISPFAQDYPRLIHNKLKEMGLEQYFSRPEAFVAVDPRVKRTRFDNGQRFGGNMELWGVTFGTGDERFLAPVDAEQNAARIVWDKLMEVEGVQMQWRQEFFEQNPLFLPGQAYANVISQEQDMLKPYIPKLGAEEGVSRVIEMFTYFDLNTSDKARNYGDNFASQLVEVLRCVPHYTAKSFLDAFFQGCYKKLRQFDLTKVSHKPDIRDSSLKEDDLEAIRMACVGISCIPRQQDKEQMMEVSKTMGRMAANDLIERQGVGMTSIFIDWVFEKLRVLHIYRERRDKYEVMKEFWIRSGVEVPDAQTLIVQWGFDPEIGSWDRSVL